MMSGKGPSYGTLLSQDDLITHALYKMGWTRLTNPESPAEWNPLTENTKPIVRLGNFWYKGPIGGSAMQLESVLGPLTKGKTDISSWSDNAQKEQGKSITAAQQASPGDPFAYQNTSIFGDLIMAQNQQDERAKRNKLLGGLSELSPLLEMLLKIQPKA